MNCPECEGLGWLRPTAHDAFPEPCACTMPAEAAPVLLRAPAPSEPPLDETSPEYRELVARSA